MEYKKCSSFFIVLFFRYRKFNVLIFDTKFMFSFCFLLLQRGHIYTSSGSFFIQPVEKYTLDNQNILHKITREKLPIDQVSIDTYRNGKVLVDEIGLHEDDDEKIDEDDELNQEIEDELDSNESILDETTTNNATDNLDAPIVTCTSEDGKSE